MSSTTWYTGLWLVEDAEQISGGIRDHSWIDATLGTAGTSLDLLAAVVDPLGSLLAWGVAWLMEHVKPLREALDQLAGNPEVIAGHAATWQNVGKLATDAQTRYADSVGREVADWLGASGDAYRKHAATVTSLIEGIASAAGGIAYAVQGAGLLVALVRGIVRDLIAQFVATLAVRLPEWLAEEGLTLGLATPAVVGQVTALVAKWVEKIQGFVRGLLSSLRTLAGKVGSLGEVLTDLKNALARLLKSDRPWRAGDPPPPPRTGGGLPTDARLGWPFVGENDPDNPRRAFRPRTVHYLTPAEREASRLFIDGDGLLRSAADGSLFDTSYGTTHWSGEGRAIFVMDGSGNLYVSLEQEPGRIHHSSLLAGEPVVGAGELEVRDGKLVVMTDVSGHYRPEAHMNDLALRSLRDQGLVTDPGFKQLGWGGTER